MAVGCEGFINPLDLECLLVNTLSGSVIMFIALAIIAIAIIAGSFRMKTLTVTLMFGLFVVLFFPILGAELRGIYIIFGLVSGFIIFKLLANLIKR